MALYLLHFDRPLHHARHYLGFSDSPDCAARVAQHQAGQGAKLTRAAVAAGITLRLVWQDPDGTRTMERKLKRAGGHGVRLCPMCRPGWLADHAAAGRARYAKRAEQERA